MEVRVTPRTKVNAKFTKRLIIAFSILASLTIAYCLFAIARIHSSQNRVQDIHSPIVFNLSNLKSQINNSIQEAFAYVVSGDIDERNEFEDFNQDCTKRFDEIRKTARYEHAESLTALLAFNTIAKTHEELVANAKIMFQEYEANQVIPPATFANFEASIDRLDSQLTDLIRQEEQNLISARQFSDQVFRQTNIHLFILAIGTLVLSTLFARFLVRSFNRYSTQQTQSQIQVENSAKRTRRILDAIPELIWVTNSEMRCTYLNRKWLNFTGQSLDEEMGTTWSESLHPEDRNRSLQTLETYFAKRMPFATELRMLRHDQSFHWMMALGTPWYEEDGSFAGFIGSCVDISERIRAEEIIRNRHKHAAKELSKVKHELVIKTRLAAIGQMSAQIAHEMRNPLGAVNNAAYFLKQRLPDNNPLWTEYLQMIEEQVQTCDKIITGLLDASRGKDPNKQSISFRDVVNQAVLQSNLPDSISLEIELEPDPFDLDADSTQLVQVLNNLFKNSLDSIRGHGHIKIVANRTNDVNTICFSDDGVGIPRDQQGSIFDLLYTTKADGTGLGLPICKQIIERHGGSLNLSENLEQGTTFCICLPRIPKTEPCWV